MEFYKGEWEASYGRGENSIFYPQTEVVRFLNRFIRKKVDENGTLRDILETKQANLRCLDFACGIGTHSFLCQEFDIQATGCDISETAIRMANERNAKGDKSLPPVTFVQTNPQSTVLPFEDDHFDFVIAESCLDSMLFEIAHAYFKELARVSTGPIFFSVIGTSVNPAGTADDTIVTTQHERGTVQSYYNRNKIGQLISGVDGHLSFVKRVQEYLEDEGRPFNERYYCVLERD
ncbi:class I SAM-dependent methyltransferase [Alphaproteobacteria bacterium]|nr:class I SAM-dependent methyltransferase [Alphaproteobacteria bacterium]